MVFQIIKNHINSGPIKPKASLNPDSNVTIRNDNNHLNIVIKYVGGYNDENICLYYEYLKYLREY